MRISLRSGLLFLIVALLAASLLQAGYLFQPLTAQASAKWIGLFAALYLGLAVFTWLQVRFWIAPLWKAAQNRLRMIWIGSAVLLGLTFFGLLAPAGVPVLEKFPLFAPWEQLEVRPELENGQSLVIQRIKVVNRQVLSSSLTLQGTWQVDGPVLRTTDTTASVILKDRIPYSVDIAFLRSPDAGQAVVTWAGQQKRIDLRLNTERGKIYTFSFDRSNLPPVIAWLRLLALPGWLGIAFAACGALFIARMNVENK